MRGLRMRTAKRRKVEKEGRAKSNRDVGSNATVAPLPRRGIQSVNIGFRVLAALAAEAGAAGLGTVAQRSNLSPSQAHRYLASLVASGMAHQDPSSGRYELGPQAIQIGLAALSRTDVFAEADPAIAAFTRETGRTTLIAARGPLGPTVVRWHAARMPVITSVTVGSVLSFLTSATGHVFLSFMNAEEAAGAIEIERGTMRSDRACAARWPLLPTRRSFQDCVPRRSRYWTYRAARRWWRQSSQLAPSIDQTISKSSKGCRQFAGS